MGGVARVVGERRERNRVRLRSLVGSMATLLPHSVVRDGAVIAAGAVVTRGSEVPSRALARGVPAEIEPEAIEEGRWAFGPERYVENARRYRDELRLLEP